MENYLKVEEKYLLQRINLVLMNIINCLIIEKGKLNSFNEKAKDNKS